MSIVTKSGWTPGTRLPKISFNRSKCGHILQFFAEIIKNNSEIPNHQTTTPLCYQLQPLHLSNRINNPTHHNNFSRVIERVPIQQRQTVPPTAPLDLPHFAPTLFNHQRTSRYVVIFNAP
ncbi:unnamed protein product [Ceratitis capitata]|uniref:(Mediterranean fruit fly) hypothetical protein n=1 Tax=Ceratitis capitata TaxID=7213 RepID=A0A811UQ36_CERCA|nr:unnamed protein product [Ceratitis capitata]